MTDRDLWERIARAYASAFGDALRGVAAFGSRARGTARPDSDHDILLVADTLAEDPFVRARQTRGPLAGLRALDVQVTARTSHEFLADVTPLHLDLALDAIILSETDAFLSRHLGRLREAITAAGLVRTERLFWRWRRAPRTADWAITWDGVRA